MKKIVKALELVLNAQIGMFLKIHVIVLTNCARPSLVTSAFVKIYMYKKKKSPATPITSHGSARS